MKVATFNINNVNKRLANLLGWLAAAEPDVVCLQELKASDADFPHAAIEAAGYRAVWRGQRTWKRTEPWVTSMTGHRGSTLPTLDTRHGDSRRTLTLEGFGRRWRADSFTDKLGTAGIDARTSWSAPWDRYPNGPRPAAGGARARGPVQARAVGPGRGRKAAGRTKCDHWAAAAGACLVSPRVSPRRLT